MLAHYFKIIRYYFEITHYIKVTTHYFEIISHYSEKVPHYNDFYFHHIGLSRLPEERQWIHHHDEEQTRVYTTDLSVNRDFSLQYKPQNCRVTFGLMIKESGHFCPYSHAPSLSLSAVSQHTSTFPAVHTRPRSLTHHWLCVRRVS